MESLALATALFCLLEYIFFLNVVLQKRFQDGNVM